MNTIFALASGAGAAGVSVIRISGDTAGEVLLGVTDLRELPVARYATRCRVIAPDNGGIIDSGLCIWFPAPHSFTGENVAELHIHGGPAVLTACFEALRRHPKTRMAEPGEFSRRAFENGKLDLTAAEGIADLVAAETEAQRRQALRQMQGELGRLYNDWRLRLVRMLAHVEAEIDFPDEGLPADLNAELGRSAADLRAEIARHLAEGERGERLRAGFQVAIVGEPNVGKSSLLNAIAGRDVAIVTEHAGTTRDAIEVRVDLGGFPVTFIDTAGLRETSDPVEREGVTRSHARASAADLTLVVTTGSDAQAMGQLGLNVADDKIMSVVNKSDLLSSPTLERLRREGRLAISAKDGSGLGDLLTIVQDKAKNALQSGATMAWTRTRHRDGLIACLDALGQVDMQNVPELIGEDLRMAARSLGRITGHVDVEDILDVVFRDFCIGK